MSDKTAEELLDELTEATVKLGACHGAWEEAEARTDELETRLTSMTFTAGEWQQKYEGLKESEKRWREIADDASKREKSLELQLTFSTANEDLKAEMKGLEGKINELESEKDNRIALRTQLDYVQKENLRMSGVVHDVMLAAKGVSCPLIVKSPHECPQQEEEEVR